MNLFFFSVSLLLFSVVSSAPFSTRKSITPAEHHIIKHSHEVNCRNCFCGEKGIQRARHECSSDRDIVLCPPTILKRVCYRCACFPRVPISPSPHITKPHPEDRHEDDDRKHDEGDDHKHDEDDDHKHDDDDGDDDMMLPTPDNDEQDMDKPTISPSPKDCATFERGGGGGNTMFDVDLFNNKGVFTVSWTMNDVPDKLEIFYEGGKIFTTVVPVTGRGMAYVKYSGRSSVITVWVTSPTDGTGWFLKFGCATSD